MQVDPRIDLAKATLAVLVLAAVANRFWLHWCSITLADAGHGCAGGRYRGGGWPAARHQRPALRDVGALGRALPGGMFLLRHADHIGVEVIMALGFCAVFANAASA